MDALVNDGLSQFAQIAFLDPATTTFEWTTGEFLSMSTSGQEQLYPRVNLHRAFPLSNRNEYISVRDKEGNEIGMVESLDQFPEFIQKIMEKELDRRYFVPQVISIISVKEEFGYSYWDVKTNAGSCRFTVRSGHGNVAPLDNGRIMITDADGSRFFIPNTAALTINEQKLLEPLVAH